MGVRKVATTVPRALAARKMSSGADISSEVEGRQTEAAGALAEAVEASEEARASGKSKVPRRYKVYTKTGDKGKSSLYSGERAPKDDLIFCALGDTDELNAHIGVAREHCQSAAIPGLDSQLAEIQSRLLDLGSSIATPLPSASASKIRRAHFAEENTDQLEQWIDAMDEELPPVSGLFVFCLALPYLILSYLILSYLILSYLILSYLVLSCLILSCLVLSCLLSLLTYCACWRTFYPLAT